MAAYDVVIIGSGAGGAPIAAELTRLGKRVLILEKGPLLLPQSANRLSDFKRDELFATGPEKRVAIPGVANNGEPYYSSHVEPDLNDEPHVYHHRRFGTDEDRATLEGYTAQCVGGGTQLYGAVSLRFSPDDFRLRSFNQARTLQQDPGDDVKREARDWPLSYEDLEPYYTKAERLVGINGTRPNQLKPFAGPGADPYQTPPAPNPISAHVEQGMDRLGMARYRTPLAVITEDHAPSGRTAVDPRSGYVNRYGDPLGLKSNTWVSLLAPIAGRANFELRPNCVVTHLESQGGQVRRVHYRDPSGLPQFVEGTIVVVACSAIESVRLLLLSAANDTADFGPRIESSGLLGRYFMTHCFGGAEVILPGRFDKSISLDSDWATDHCARREFLDPFGLWAGAAIYNNTSDQALPISLLRTHGSQDIDTIWKSFVEQADLRGDALVGMLDRDFGRRLSVSFMANQVPLPTNRIELHPQVTDKWNRPVAYIVKDWHSHDIHMMNVLAAQCDRILREGVPDGQAFESGGVYSAENAQARIANHILGGARFGNDRSDSVLDVNCRAWEFENLYVTDGAFMPTSGGANPTLTIQANSFRVADHLTQVV